MTTDTADLNQLGKIEFGEYVVNLDAFELTCSGEPIAVEPQVFNLLAYLIRHHDRLVTKDELLDELWGHRFVSESALSTQIKTLRRAVGDDGQSQKVIQTVRGRGFRFVADLKSSVETPVARPLTTAAHNLPRERTQLFGRESDLLRLQEVVGQNRLTTVLGIGGIGKTRLAMRLGRDLVADFPDGVWFVDLIPLTGTEAVETAVANALGLALTAGEVRPQLIEAMTGRNLLLVLDNCEHLKDEVADLLNDLLEFTHAPRFLATSRDPLELIDEHRFFLEPLATDLHGGESPSVKLFIATAERHGVPVEAGSERAIARICDQLDGLPLAIELAAAQLRHLTIDELMNRLQKRFEVLAGRERSPSGRQTNLLGVLQDTWGMLASNERDLLGLMAAFPSRFSISCIEEVLADVHPGELSLGISRLVDLGLIQRTAGRGNWWRLLETVRMFALEQLPGEQNLANARYHANWCLERLGRFPDDQMDNLSQADWCLNHYPDLSVAEQFFVEQAEMESAYAVCAGTGLMVQLDDGARAREKLLRARSYLQGDPSEYWAARLHGIAGLCAQANRAPDMLLEHADEYLKRARKLDDGPLLATALLMKSLTTGFVDPDLAHEQLAEIVAIGRDLNNMSLVDSGECYHAWQYVVERERPRGRALAEEIYNRFKKDTTDIDNPAYNCAGIVVTCTVVEEAEVAREWLGRLMDFPAVRHFWGIQNLSAAVHASLGDFASSARLCLDVKARLNRATRDEFPDLLVTAVLGAVRQEDLSAARRWLAAIRYSGVPIQMYHSITIYRQLYDLIGVGEFNRENAPGLEDVREEVKSWWEEQAADS